MHLDRQPGCRAPRRVGQADALLDVSTAVGSTVLAMWRAPGTLQKLRPMSPFADTVEVVVQTSAEDKLCVELHAAGGEAYINVFPMRAAMSLPLWETTQ